MRFDCKGSEQRSDSIVSKLGPNRMGITHGGSTGSN